MSVLAIVLLIVLIGAGLITGTLAYINHVYSNASTGIAKIANKLDYEQISLSFMIPQSYSQTYVKQVVNSINNIDSFKQQQIYIVIRVKSLGMDEQEQIGNFNHILDLVSRKRQNTTKRLSVILAGLFGQYNQLEYDLFMEAVDRGFQDIFITIQANRSTSESKVRAILQKSGGIRLVKGYYLGDITNREQIHLNYMKLARCLIESKKPHILGTHNLIKVQQLQKEFPLMHQHINLAYLYYVNDYYQHQLTLAPELKKFTIIPQIQTSDLSALSVAPYMLDMVKQWNYWLLFNLMGINRFLPKFQNIPKYQSCYAKQVQLAPQ